MYFKDVSNTKAETKKPWTFGDITKGTLFRDPSTEKIYICMTTVMDCNSDFWNAIDLCTGDTKYIPCDKTIEVYIDDVELDFSKFKAYLL